jgi:hypothetical protein
MDFRNRFLSAIDNVAEQTKALVNDISDSINSIDFNETYDYLMGRKDILMEKSNSIMKDLGDFFKQVKDSMTDFSVTVPFDEASGEKFSYSIDGDTLTVEVTFSDESQSRSNKTEVLIPENCDVSRISHVVNNVTKSLIISIPKAVEKPKDGKTTEKAKKGKKVAPKPASKLKRDSKGRFVKG